ncbi:MAG: class I SAM-dependent methyltransferase [Gemmataceae bacterium]
MPVTTGMKGAGFYDRHSAAQLASMRFVRDWIEDAIAALPLPQGSQPFTVLDLGSSEGANAILGMSWIVEGVRRRRADQAIQTIYSDLPSNNFNRLFLNLDEARKAGGIPAGVYPSVVGGSFYEPLMPSRSVHFAMVFNAALWLDALPAAPVPNFVVFRRSHPPRPDLNMPQETADAFARQADGDLVRLLQCRANELTPGGKLLIVGPGDSEERCVADGLYDVVNDACLDLVAAGRVPQQYYERFTMPLYFRTVAETLAPLERQGSPVKDAFAVDRAETLEVPTPFFVEFDRGGDAAKLADAYTGFLRAFTEPIARAALVGDAGDDAVIDELYDRVHARMRSAPDRYRFHYQLTAALFTRR